MHFKPSSGRLAGKLVHGVQYYYTDYEAAEITLTQFYVMQAVWELYSRNPFKDQQQSNLTMFNKVCGTDFVSSIFSKTMKVADIYDYWTADEAQFKQMSQDYYLY